MDGRIEAGAPQAVFEVFLPRVEADFEVFELELGLHLRRRAPVLHLHDELRVVLVHLRERQLGTQLREAHGGQ
jgi:hypothetical protein